MSDRRLRYHYLRWATSSLNSSRYRAMVFLVTARCSGSCRASASFSRSNQLAWHRWASPLKSSLDFVRKRASPYISYSPISLSGGVVVSWFAVSPVLLVAGLMGIDLWATAIDQRGCDLTQPAFGKQLLWYQMCHAGPSMTVFRLPAPGVFFFALPPFSVTVEGIGTIRVPLLLAAY